MTEEQVVGGGANNDNNNNISDGTPAPPPPPSPSSSPRPSDIVTFPPTGGRRHMDASHELFPPSARVARHGQQQQQQPELMGPLLRRKKVVSMPLGAGGDFFVHQDTGGPHRQLFDEYAAGYPVHSAAAAAQQHQQQHQQHRIRQQSYTGVLPTTRVSSHYLERQKTPPTPSHRVRQGSAGVLGNVLRRKQVSLDLLGPNDFFATPEEVSIAAEEVAELPAVVKEEEEGEEGGAAVVEPKEQVKLFRPLRFAPRTEIRGRRSGGGHGGGGGGAAAVSKLSSIDEETTKAFERYSQSNAKLKLQVSSLVNRLEEEGLSDQQVKDITAQINMTQSSMAEEESLLKTHLLPGSTVKEKETGVDRDGDPDGIGAEDPGAENGVEDTFAYGFDDEIIRANRGDKIKAGILFVIMLALTIVVACWDTHLDEENFIHSPVGLACVTQCEGNLEYRDFFGGHNHFKTDQVIGLIMHMDPNEEAHMEEAHAIVEVIGTETGQVKATTKFGPPDNDERISQEENIKVSFDNPDEHHILNITSTNPDIELSFTLSAKVLTPLADKSELVAALIMVCVYVLILLELIHRTLVAVLGSMVALMFYFIMHDGETESIAQLMLHFEWSTLGLLFGMMLIVGELSHTGVFEWCSVRLLVASKGSFVRLMVLLCILTAVASAFLDNVTTMLLVAPVTIDMCNILQIDPRPYLIGEVLLSNIGGTATLIGDPPNIIIGSSFEEIGFVDFIIHVFPAIFVFVVPISLVLVCWVYRYYLTTEEMRILDTTKLKQTYPIYDEPRLMIAGTVTFFVIVMFFLHPVHHKDTAWIALLGAFICISFTNPHDVQEALRSHVEWDTLLFFAGLFVLVEVCAAMGLLDLIGDALATYIESQEEDKQLAVAITLILWVSAITSAFLDNIPYTATMIPIIQILSDELPDTLPIETLAWALSFGACLGGNGTLLGASANIVTAGISTNKGFSISFLNFLYPGMLTMVVTVAISNLYMLVRYAWT